MNDSASRKARLADLYRQILILKISRDLCGCHTDANGGLSQILTSSRHAAKANRASISECGAQFGWDCELFRKHRLSTLGDSAGVFRLPSRKELRRPQEYSARSRRPQRFRLRL